MNPLNPKRGGSPPKWAPTRTRLGPSFPTLPLGFYPYSHASKLRKTQWEKYEEKLMVYFCYVARIASLKTSM